MIESTKIKELKGIGEKTEKLFHKIGVDTVGDLIRCYPRGYDVYEEAAPISELEEGLKCKISFFLFTILRYRIIINRADDVTAISIQC